MSANTAHYAVIHVPPMIMTFTTTKECHIGASTGRGPKIPSFRLFEKRLTLGTQ